MYWLDEREEEHCKGQADGCAGCELCTRTAQVTKFRFARKALPCGALAGDLVARTSGFLYQVNGPRIEYLTPRPRIAWYGPQWGNAYVGIVEIHGFNMKPKDKWPHLATMMEWRDRLMMTAPNRYALTTPQEYSDRIDAWLTALSQFEETYGTWGYKTTTRQEIVDSALTIRQTRIAEMDAKEEYIRQVRIAREGDIGMEFELHGRQYRKAGHAYTGLSRCSWSSGEVDMATAVMKVPVIDLSSNRQHVLEL